MVISMQYKAGNSKYVRLNGESEEIICPNCGEKVHFGIFSNSEIDLIPEFPLFDAKIIYFAVCPNCASVFKIRNGAGSGFKDNKLSIGNFDFEKLPEF